MIRKYDVMIHDKHSVLYVNANILNAVFTKFSIRPTTALNSLRMNHYIFMYFVDKYKGVSFLVKIGSARMQSDDNWPAAVVF